jgi:hypothetical protein
MNKVQVTYVGPCDHFVNRQRGLNMEYGEAALVSEQVAAVLEGWPTKFKIERAISKVRRARKERSVGRDAGTV